MLPANAPNQAEKWQDVFKDLDKIAFMGLTHWQSSRFFAYFPTATSYPSMLADILTDCCSCIGFTWVSAIPTYNTILALFFNEVMSKKQYLKI